MNAPYVPDPIRALIFAPLGRDAPIAAQLLGEANFASTICEDVPSFVAELERGADFAVVTEDALSGRNLQPLHQWISTQPFWSDLPFLILTFRGGGVERNPAAQRLTETLGNATFLERPFHPTTFVSVARTAARSRLRQYKARDDQLAIRESEARLRFALEAGDLGSWELDTRTQTLSCSAICKAAFGRSEDESFTYANLIASIHAEDRERVSAAMLAAIEGQGDYHAEYRVFWRDGSLHCIEASGRKLVHAEQQVTLIGVLVDVTERRQAESALRASEERYRTLADALPQLVWTCRQDGDCDYLSPQWVIYTGIAAEEQLGSRWLGALHPDDRERVRLHWMNVVAGLTPYDIDFRIRRHDGEYHWFKTRGIPIRRTDGQVLSWFGTCTDIQDIVEAREVLTRSSEELAELVSQRTAALEDAMRKRAHAEEALRQSQKMEAVGQLTGGIAHDFNNLIQVVSGGLEILKHGGRISATEKVLEGMRRATDRASQLTKQLLAFSRKQTLHPEHINLEQQIVAMRELLDRSLRGDIGVETDFSQGLWPVEVDPTQLELAIINIAVNARDAMPNGGTLTISARNEPGSRDSVDGNGKGDFVRLSVADSGTGMDAHTLEHIFEPFYTTKEVGKGSGLGLPQVYGFAQQSGGDVRVESRLGQGTAVTLLLPRSMRDVPPVVEAEEIRIAPEVRLAQGESAHCAVLLVEDDDEVAALTTEMLTQLGYDTTRVSTAIAALGALADERPINLVFTDVMMPGGMSGAELAREIRRRRPQLPVILTTGYDGDAVAAANVQDFPLLRKPYRLEALSVMLESAAQAHLL